MKKRLFTAVCIMLVLIFTISVNAEEIIEPTTPEYVEPNIVISADSVNQSVIWDVYYDALTDKTILSLSVEDLGICIYDVPETSYIDGIRINGETVDSLKIPIDASVENKVVVRTVYKDDFTGTLAQISDGTYDYINLLKNPVGLLTAGYYVLAFILTLVSIIMLFTGKKKKVKTSEDIAKSVDTRANEAFNLMSTKVADILNPFVSSIYETQETLVKAIVLMNSKEPNSHLEALECLKKISIADVNSVISKVESEITNTINTEQAHKNNVLEDLTKIAETAQEESANVIKELPIL